MYTASSKPLPQESLTGMAAQRLQQSDAFRPVPTQFPSHLPRSAGSSIRLTSVLVATAFALFPVVRWEPAPIDFLAPVLATLLGLNIVAMDHSFLINRIYLTILYLLFFIGIITIYQTTDPVMSFRFHAITGLVMILSLASHLVGQDARLVRIAFRSLLLGSALIISMTLLVYLTGFNPIGIPFSSGGVRFVALAKNPNALGILLSIPLTISISDLLHRNTFSITGLRPRTLTGLTVLFGISIVFTFSRNALVVATVSLLALYVISLLTSRGRVRPTVAGIVPFAVIAIAILAYRLAPAAGVQYITGKLEQTNVSNPRVVHQREMLDRAISADFPLLGRGPLSGVIDLGLGAHNA